MSSLRQRILEWFEEFGPATAGEAADNLEVPPALMSSLASTLRQEGKLKRVAQILRAGREGAPPWQYVFVPPEARQPIPVCDPEPVPVVKIGSRPVRQGSGQIAGPPYHRGLAGWGIWR